jgi:two-component system, cell cycle sensor histidine kinase and response regulator CckA
MAGPVPQPDDDLAQLRKRAEQQAQPLGPGETDPRWPFEARKALHELHVHQIELEMQNEELRAARQRLETSQARYFDLYDSAPAGYLTLNQAGEIVEANRAAAALLGLGQAELPGKRLSGFILRDDQDNYYFLRNRLKTGRPQTCELRLNKREGEPFWARLDASAAPHENDPSAWRVVIVDITERKRAEDAAQESLRQLRLITDNMAAGVTRCSRDLKYIWVSPIYAAWLGRRGPEEIAGRAIIDVVGPEYYETIRPYVERVLSGERVQYEARIPYPGVGPRWIQAVYVPTKGRDDRVDGWIGVVTDLTQRHEAEERLRESEKFLNAAERLAHVGNWRWDIESNRIFWSEGMFQIFGQHPDFKPSYDEFVKAVGPQDRERVAAELSDALANKTGFSSEAEITRPDGELRTVSFVAELRLDQQGAPVEMFGFTQDVTDLRLAQKEDIARQKLESLGTLAGGIAHDFNNLLGGVLAGAALALEEYRSGLSPEEELKRIREAAVLGSEIVRQMMIYAGKETEAVTLVDVSRIAGEMADLLTVSMSKHAKLETHLAQDLPAVRAGAGQIRQIVMNLVVNASEAMGDRDGVVRVTTCRAEGDYVRLEVADTGPGISAETQARMFDPFFTTKPKGHGLGLAVIHGIVRDLGGSIQLASEPGKGATFRILLPCAETRAVETVSISRTEERALPQPAATVLLVEDEDSLRLPLAKMLRRKGFEVLEACNGSAAIELLRASPVNIDMMLLDMTIPGPSSHEIAAVAAEARPGLKVVLTSAHDEQRVRATVAAPQQCAFIRKPFQISDLLQTLGATVL